MDAKTKELAFRAIACRRWRWMPGMISIGCSGRILAVSPDGELIAGDEHPWEEDGFALREWDDDEAPDLTDPATLGCLLALVREAHHGDVCTGPVLRMGRLMWGLVGLYRGAACSGGAWDSEAEALVAALETAP